MSEYTHICGIAGCENRASKGDVICDEHIIEMLKEINMWEEEKRSAACSEESSKDCDSK